MSEKLKLVDAPLKCQYRITIKEQDQQSRWRTYHKLCNKPASEIEIAGLLTSAKAILCPMHAAHADYRNALSDRGYPLGKVNKDDKQAGHIQTRNEKTGIIRR